MVGLCDRDLEKDLKGMKKRLDSLIFEPQPAGSQGICHSIITGGTSLTIGPGKTVNFK